MKLELRAITNSHLIRDKPVMISSTTPSAKYSCSGSPLMFWNGRHCNRRLIGQRELSRRFRHSGLGLRRVLHRARGR